MVGFLGEFDRLRHLSHLTQIVSDVMSQAEITITSFDKNKHFPKFKMKFSSIRVIFNEERKKIIIFLNSKSELTSDYCLSLTQHSQS